ncbi:MAG TPA: hypothetical protein VGQ65_23705 [Thermoanaerobaculia bacterium]|jgi:hypothetical protein|nr:hypothetical protein [Thermoanaerobaculia bacterium]
MLQTASFDIFVLADPQVGGIFAGVLLGIVKLLKSLAEIRKLLAETKKINAEAADLLSKQASALRERGLREIAAEAMSKAVLPDVSRANELAIANRQAVTYIESKIQLNVVFEVRASPTVGNVASEEVEGTAKSLQQILEGGNALAELASNQVVPLLAERGPSDS